MIIRGWPTLALRMLLVERGSWCSVLRVRRVAWRRCIPAAVQPTTLDARDPRPTHKSTFSSLTQSCSAAPCRAPRHLLCGWPSTDPRRVQGPPDPNAVGSRFLGNRCLVLDDLTFVCPVFQLSCFSRFSPFCERHRLSPICRHRDRKAGSLWCEGRRLSVLPNKLGTNRPLRVASPMQQGGNAAKNTRATANRATYSKPLEL